VSVETLAGGRYRIEGDLGHGGMAAVYRARDAELDRPVAIKVLAEHLAGNPAFRDRFLREARLAARLSHPNVVQVFDAGEDEGRPFIVMEYVEGEPLADTLKREGRLAPAYVVDLALQVCGGLEHAHAAGLVHRDIKPGNLLVRGDGVVKVADFGIARAAETTKLTQIGSVLGTAAYLSPEQAAGEEVTAAADIYSLGCVLYEALTGRTPYVFQNLAELAVKHQQPIAPVRELAREVPEELEAAVMRCLARNPEYRPDSAAELARELAAASPEPPTQALPAASGVRATEVPTVPLAAEPAATGVTRVARRRDYALPRRALWTVLAVAALVALVAVVALVAARGDGDAGEPAEPPPAQVEPVPRSDDPAEQARNLAEWLREHSR
jgi:serine/threonine protein kinase